MLENVKTVHLIGIGGIGVSGVARILHGDGYEVRGSDVRESAITEALREEGMDVRIGHDASHIDGVDLLVLSTAIPEHNVELVAAREQGLPIVHRSEILNELVQDRRVIGVTGTHGKGTVSSMIAWILETAGWDPGFVIGGMLNNFSVNARAGGGEWMVLEVDESDGTHQNFDLDYVLCNFLELDHLNYYDDLDDIVRTMIRFVDDNPRLKELFLNLDCQGNRQLAEEVAMRPTGYGVEHDTEFKGSLLGDGQLPLRFEAAQRFESLGEFELPLPGRYNVVNAMGAMAVCRRLGVPVESIREALASYKGLENRFTIEQGGGVTVVKDYISHPTGMRKVLQSAKDLVDGRVISVFKPYRYTLIKYLQDEYGKAFEGSDEVIISKMYAAEEDPIPGIDTHTVVDRIRENGLNVTYIEDQNDITEYLHEVVRPGDKVIFFGGDDYFQMADGFVAELAQRAGHAADIGGQPRVSGPLATEPE